MTGIRDESSFHIHKISWECANLQYRMHEITDYFVMHCWNKYLQTFLLISVVLWKSRSEFAFLSENRIEEHIF